MSVWIDMIGSFVLCSLLLLNVIQINADLVTRAHQGTQDQIVQNNATTVTQFMTSDLRKLGYGVLESPILLAQPDRIRFLSDIDINGIVDTLEYYTSSTAQASDTPNLTDRYLYRKINATAPLGLRFGLTHLQLRYYSASNDSLAFPVSTDAIRKIHVTLTIESPNPYDTAHTQTYIAFSVWPKNLAL